MKDVLEVMTDVLEYQDKYLADILRYKLPCGGERVTALFAGWWQTTITYLQICAAFLEANTNPQGAKEITRRSGVSRHLRSSLCLLCYTRRQYLEGSKATGDPPAIPTRDALAKETFTLLQRIDRELPIPSTTSQGTWRSKIEATGFATQLIVGLAGQVGAFDQRLCVQENTTKDVALQLARLGQKHANLEEEVRAGRASTAIELHSMSATMMGQGVETKELKAVQAVQASDASNLVESLPRIISGAIEDFTKAQHDLVQCHLCCDRRTSMRTDCCHFCLCRICHAKCSGNACPACRQAYRLISFTTAQEKTEEYENISASGNAVALSVRSQLGKRSLSEVSTALQQGPMAASQPEASTALASLCYSDDEASDLPDPSPPAAAHSPPAVSDLVLLPPRPSTPVHPEMQGTSSAVISDGEDDARNASEASSCPSTRSPSTDEQQQTSIAEPCDLFSGWHREDVEGTAAPSLERTFAEQGVPSVTKDEQAWTCAHCTLINSAVDVCGACGEVKGGVRLASDADGPSSPVVPSHDWPCLHCTYLNPKDYLECFACQNPMAPNKAPRQHRELRGLN